MARQARDYSAAMRLAQQALSLADDVDEAISALDGLAEVYSGSDLYDDAIGVLREILKIDHEHSDTMASIAHCYYMKNRYAKAEEWARKALLFDPTNESALSTLGYAQAAQY